MPQEKISSLDSIPAALAAATARHLPNNMGEAPKL